MVGTCNQSVPELAIDSLLDHNSCVFPSASADKSDTLLRRTPCSGEAVQRHQITSQITTSGRFNPRWFFDHLKQDVLKTPTGCDDDFGLTVYVAVLPFKVRHRGMTDVSRPHYLPVKSSKCGVAEFGVLFLLLTCWKHTKMCEHMETWVFNGVYPSIYTISKIKRLNI